MKKHLLSTALLLALLTGIARAQDTFSIVAVDSLTGEVGSAGASCISATNLKNFFPAFDPDFLGDLLPGRGAINTQSFYLQQNQLNARARLAEGLDPQAVVNWLAANDAQGNPTQRQYGVAALQNGVPVAAAYTGINCLDVKGHRVGPNYSIQGNILLNPGILDSMEARFLRTGGCLANRLMAAMQGAKVPGADSRCFDNGTSAMFAFIKVARPTDSIQAPFLRLFVSYDSLGIEPIDSLQALFDANFVCLSHTDDAANDIRFSATPNPGAGDKQTDTHIAQVKNTKTATAKPTTGTPPLSQGRDGGGACDDCPEMVFVAGGRYTMGCKNSQRDGECYDWEKPPHEVTVQDFYIGKYEVTQAEWRRVMGSNPPELYNTGCDQCPVERVSWNDVQEFIKKLNAQTGKNYRLPTEAEWEYAARGGNKTKGYLYSGSNNMADVAWYDGNTQIGNTNGSQKTTRPVGTRMANELGLYDMSGNVWEWVEDDLHNSFVGAPTDGSAWVDVPRSAFRVSRGGGWAYPERICRTAGRDAYAPANRSTHFGFRLALQL